MKDSETYGILYKLEGISGNRERGVRRGRRGRGGRRVAGGAHREPSSLLSFFFFSIFMEQE
jgi:hypothetical protein